MARRAILVAMTLAVAALPAASHDVEFTPEQRRALRADVDRLRAMLRSDHLTAEMAAVFDFDGFRTHDLAHVLEFMEEVEESAELRDALAHVCRTVILRRSPLGQLRKASDICFLFASRQHADWMEGYRLLRREPLGKELDQAVIALWRDNRPELRLIAIRHATTLVSFGRESEGLVATVLAGLTDRDPDVAANCLFHAADTGCKRVVDRMVASLADDRALVDRPLPPPFLQLHGYESVGAVAASRLSWMVYEERRARIPNRSPPRPVPETWVPPRLRVKHAILSPDEIRAWWKDNRAAFGFGTPRPMWKRVFDKVQNLRRGQPATVRLDTGDSLRITLKEYTEGLDDTGLPVTTIELELHDARREIDMTIGNPEHWDWWIPRASHSWGVDGGYGSIACRAVFLPTYSPGKVRMRLVLDVEHE